MADSKTTALTELTAFDGDETFYVVDDDDGTPVSKRVTIENLTTEVTDGIADAIADGDASTLTSAQSYADGKVDNTAYASGWDGDTTDAPSKNAVYDQIEALIAQIGWVPIATITLGADTASFDFTSIPATYQHLEFRGVMRTDRASNTSDSVNIAFNNDTTAANYDRQALSSIGATTTSAFSASTRTLGIVTAATATADQFAEVAIRLQRYASTTIRKVATWESGVPTTAGTALEIHERSVLWKSTAAVNRITFTPGAGTNFLAGSSMTLYGLKAAA